MPTSNVAMSFLIPYSYTSRTESCSQVSFTEGRTGGEWGNKYLTEICQRASDITGHITGFVMRIVVLQKHARQFTTDNLSTQVL